MTVSSRRWIPETFYGFPVTGSTVKKAEAMQVLTAAGLCLEGCGRLADDESNTCLFCRREEN